MIFFSLKDQWQWVTFQNNLSKMCNSKKIFNRMDSSKRIKRWNQMFKRKLVLVTKRDQLSQEMMKTKISKLELVSIRDQRSQELMKTSIYLLVRTHWTNMSMRKMLRVFRMSKMFKLLLDLKMINLSSIKMNIIKLSLKKMKIIKLSLDKMKLIKLSSEKMKTLLLRLLDQRTCKSFLFLKMLRSWLQRTMDSLVKRIRRWLNRKICWKKNNFKRMNSFLRTTCRDQERVDARSLGKECLEEPPLRIKWHWISL